MTEGFGTLYIVATPIGNLSDMTPRAVEALRGAALIAAEDTRHSKKLLALFDIHTPMKSCHKFNEESRAQLFLSVLGSGKDVALITDAGTPCISDPGHRLVARAAACGAPVVPVPGCNAAVAALSVCGFDVGTYTFLGFLDRKKPEIPHGVVVFYESPRRIAATLAKLPPGTAVFLANDISKKFERFYRGTPSEVIAELQDNPSAEKGEYTCVAAIPAPEAPQAREISAEALLADAMAAHNLTPKDAVEHLRAQGLCTKKEAYAAMLRLKEAFR
jgi:16S rRNA (cytidine1402-2'-O)-methyltransferase